MNKINIKFNDVTDVNKFVHILSKYDADFNLYCGSYCVDAKSLLGIMHLGINNEIALQMYTDDCEELCREIAKYAA